MCTLISDMLLEEHSNSMLPRERQQAKGADFLLIQN